MLSVSTAMLFSLINIDFSPKHGRSEVRLTTPHIHLFLTLTHLSFISWSFSSCVSLRQIYALTQSWPPFTLNFFTHTHRWIPTCVNTCTQTAFFNHPSHSRPFMLWSRRSAHINNVSLFISTLAELLWFPHFWIRPFCCFLLPIYSFIHLFLLLLWLSLFLPSLYWCKGYQFLAKPLCIINEQLKTHSRDN